jgi:hypothetical protein
MVDLDAAARKNREIFEGFVREGIAWRTEFLVWLRAKTEPTASPFGHMLPRHRPLVISGRNRPC